MSEVVQTRAINVGATEGEVTESCRKKGVLISAIEALPSGGTRVVLTNMAGADRMRRAFGRKVIAGEVQRLPSRTRYR